MATADLSTLTARLRLKIGDTDPASYRYSDAWLLIALQASVETLTSWWNMKYLLDGSGQVYRNTAATNFIFDEATYGVIEPQDKMIIVIMAAFIILEGSLENSAWSLVSWRDNEVSVSSQEVSRTRGETLRKLWDELLSMITPPTKKLAWVLKGSLPGYLGNQYERDTEL